MTPIDLARNLAASAELKDQALGVAIVTRGLTDDTEDRQGWPLDWLTVERAAEHIGLTPTPELVQLALGMAPNVSDAMLNKGAAR